MHRISWDASLPLPGPGELVTITGDEAAHGLRVKRLHTGEAIELLDGFGGVASGTLAEAAPPQVPQVAEGRRRRPPAGLLVRVVSSRREPEPSTKVEVWAATPKGSRVDELIEGLSEVGAWSWTPLRSARAVVEPRPTKLDRLGRLAAESAKQCGRAWFLRVERERPFADAIAPAPGTRIVLADAGGQPWRDQGTVPPGRALRLLIGPEGGWTPDELAAAETAGASVARFGPHAMRIETAGVAAAAVLVNLLAARG